MNTIIYLYQTREQERFVIEKWKDGDGTLIRLGMPVHLWQNIHQLDSTGLRFLGENPNWTFCVYDDFLRDKMNKEVWWQRWNVPEFEDYHEYRWVKKLVRYASNDRLLILGTAECIPEILYEKAKETRSVKWMLKEEQYTPGVQDFVERFYDEYGLAIEIHVLPADVEWVRVRPAASEPVNVLDFTGEAKMSACDVAKGSIWLDMDSMDGKSRRIETRNPDIGYFSLKKLWKQRQKDFICLDTINKNRYNT